ncbi:hypothetical protein GALL_503780 [mine drainage metagenome]|uniref:Uncharacterized protein n=1 Tax=mine drainage metagenome TaxID=410659 RepID=A0A1J5PA02_9ZZZZ
MNCPLSGAGVLAFTLLPRIRNRMAMASRLVMFSPVTEKSGNLLWLGM